MSRHSNEKLRAVFGLAWTLAVLYFVSNRLLALAVLLLSWFAIFFPWLASEWILMGIAASFFLVQDYICLKAGVFEFKFRDILRMPFYEPFLWGFYFLALKRFVSGSGPTQVRIGWKSIAGFLATTVTFSLLSGNSGKLSYITFASTAFLIVLFHRNRDLQYGLSALILGLVVELFGVATGLWWYPQPDFLGIPFWFAAMWISSGVLGYHFMIPLSELLSGKRDYRA